MGEIIDRHITVFAILTIDSDKRATGVKRYLLKSAEEFENTFPFLYSVPSQVSFFLSLSFYSIDA